MSSTTSAAPRRYIRQKMRRQRILEGWPHLVWIVVLGAAVYTYTRGHVFERMNGAVDMNFQSLSATQGGRLKEFAVKIGDEVEPGGEVARLDPVPWIQQIDALLKSAAVTRDAETTELTRVVNRTAKDLHLMRTELAADEGRLAALPAVLEGRFRKQESTDAFRSEAARLTGRAEAGRKAVKEAEVTLTAQQFKEGAAAARAAALRTLTSESSPSDVLPLLDEFQKDTYLTLRSGLEHCVIRTATGGKVERLLKSPGDPLLPGEWFMEIVEDPRKVTAFLPAAVAAVLKPGDSVWITAAHGNPGPPHEATVRRVAARTESKADPGEDAPFRRRTGQTVTIDAPAAADFIPGQPVTVHTTRPGLSGMFRRFLPFLP